MKNHYLRFLYLGTLFVILTFLASCSNAAEVDPVQLNGTYWLFMTVKEINDPQDKYSVNNIMIGEARASSAEILIDKQGNGNLSSGSSTNWEVVYKNGEFKAQNTTFSGLESTLTGTVSKDKNGEYMITGTWQKCDGDYVVLSGTFNITKDF